MPCLPFHKTLVWGIFCFPYLDWFFIRTSHVSFSLLTVFGTENYFSLTLLCLFCHDCKYVTFILFNGMFEWWNGVYPHTQHDCFVDTQSSPPNVEFKAHFSELSSLLVFLIWYTCEVYWVMFSMHWWLCNYGNLWPITDLQKNSNLANLKINVPSYLIKPFLGFVMHSIFKSNFIIFKIPLIISMLKSFIFLE